MPTNAVEIRNASPRIPSRIPAERIPIGETGDYKPNIARMPDGALLLTAFHTNSDKKPTDCREDILLFRSGDGGQSWSPADNLGRRVNLLGREPYLTVLRDGTILITCHFLQDEQRSDLNYTANFVHRSADGGQTWTTVEVRSDQMPAGTQYGTTRNVLELADGTLLHVVTTRAGLGDFLWASADGGQTWHETGGTSILGLPENYPSGVFEESHLLQTNSGRLIMISRIDHQHYPIPGRDISDEEYVVINRLLDGYRVLYDLPIMTSITDYDFDQFNHLKLFTSDDDGATWRPGADIGDYGMMYPSILRLGGGRIAFTFTVRHVSPPLGVRAVLGTETDDGIRFDFDHNLFVLDDKTPLDRQSGGGFGNTVQAVDGTLVTPCSYRGEDGGTHMEVVRWRPPEDE